MDESLLDFAYKYPFSGEAKELVQGLGNSIDIRYIDLGSQHLENAFAKGLDYSNIRMSSVKVDYVMAYLYSRMLLSAAKRRDLIRAYAIAEAKRSAEALLASDSSEMMRISAQLGLKVNNAFGSRKPGSDEEFTIGFVDYVKNAPKIQGFELVNQRMSAGVVSLDRNRMARVIEQAMAREIAKGLPVASADLPKRIIDYARTMKFRSIQKAETKGLRGREEWIERLLETPIADVRHRTVNLILAPYLVNSKGLEVEQASRIIVDYIERCKQIDPSTKINERYIEYQCNYAKKRGLRPLSLDRARELLGDQIDFEAQPAKGKQ